MKRPGITAFVKWIAENESDPTMDAEGDVQFNPMVRMVSDCFGVDPLGIAKQVVRRREMLISAGVLADPRED